VQVLTELQGAVTRVGGWVGEGMVGEGGRGEGEVHCYCSSTLPPIPWQGVWQERAHAIERADAVAAVRVSI
jgi:hypothetical protein